MTLHIKTDINNYIEYLNKAHSLYISLHPMEYEELISTTELLRFNMHTNPYCLYVKKEPRIARHCVSCQNKVFEKCKNGAFGGVCHAGVFEYIYPFNNKHRVIGFISVSGYKADQERAVGSIGRISRKYELPFDELQDIYYENLGSEHPDKNEINTLVRPLCHMLELAYSSLPDVQSSEKKAKNFYMKILYYLNQNHCSQISLDDMCRELYCSKSYISHVFKSYNGQSIREYLNNIRINDAKRLLINSDINITQIALSVGFSDSNYFAVVFKKLEKMTPCEYRKKYKNE